MLIVNKTASIFLGVFVVLPFQVWSFNKSDRLPWLHR